MDVGVLFAKYCDAKDLQEPHQNTLSQDALKKLITEYESNRHETLVIKPLKFKPSELNYLEDLIEDNIEEGSYWGNKKQFIKRQKSVKEKIIKLRAAV